MRGLLVPLVRPDQIHRDPQHGGSAVFLRRRYRQRRDAFIEALACRLPDWQVMGSAGGLHLTVALPPEMHEGRLVAAAIGLGLSVLGLASSLDLISSRPGRSRRARRL